MALNTTILFKRTMFFLLRTTVGLDLSVLLTVRATSHAQTNYEAKRGGWRDPMLSQLEQKTNSSNAPACTHTHATRNVTTGRMGRARGGQPIPGAISAKKLRRVTPAQRFSVPVRCGAFGRSGRV